MKLLHEETYKNIVQNNTNQNEQEITKELYTPMKNGSGKYYVSHKHKTGRETY